VRALSVHLARLRRVAALHQGGVSLQVAAKAAGVFWKDEREFSTPGSPVELTELERLQPGILAADRACKQTGAPDRVLAEAAGARRGGAGPTIGALAWRASLSEGARLASDARTGRPACSKLFMQYVVRQRGPRGEFPH